MSDLEKLDIENTSYSMILDMQKSATGSMVSWNAAWLRFDRQYKKYLLSICGKYGLRGAEAEDVVMRVEEKLRYQIKKYQPEKGKFRPWLWTITRNASWDELKKARRKHEVAVDNVPELSGEDPNDGWDKEYQQYCTNEALEAMKSEVKPQKHQIFKLYCIQGKPAKEVASALDVSVNVVYMTKNELMPLFEKLVKAVED